MIGTTVFDMHEGDDYWIYQPTGASWPDSIECVYSGPPDHTYVVARGDRPLTAPETVTERGETFTYYGTLRGHRTEATVLVECPFDVFLLMPSRAPIWYLGAALVAAALAGVLGLVAIVVSAVRRRPRRSRVAALPVPAGGGAGPAPPGTTAVAPAAPNRRAGPSPAWYLAVIPFVLVSVCFCGAGTIAGLATGFTRSFEAPDIGSRRAGAVTSVYSPDIEYVLYADQADVAPSDQTGCLLRDQDTGASVPLGLRPDRPFGIVETTIRNEHTYRYVGRFQVNDVILGAVQCDEGSSLLVRPSERPRLLVWAGVGLALGTVLLGAAVTVGIAAVRRSRRRPVGRTG